MPTVTINRKVFEELVGKKLPEDMLRDRISMLGTDLESVDAEQIIVEIFPNRPDMLSEQGFARAFASFIGARKGLRKYNVRPSGQKVVVQPSVSKVRPYTACALVKNIGFTDEKIREIIQIQEKLHVTFGRNRKKLAIGIYPLEHIKLPITYFAADPNSISFQPLEFPKKITGMQILSQHPTGREYGHLLEGKDVFPFFKDAAGEILSMPPIINSHNTGKVTEKTTAVFIECSGFEFDTLSTCLNIIVTALADMGGEVYSMELEYNEKKIVTPNLEPRRMKLDSAYINKLLGLKLSEKELVELLARMGHGYDGEVLVPAYRADIMHPIDLAEDVAIAHGYENFTPEIPRVATIAQEDPFETYRRKIANMLIGLGMVETNTYHITNHNDNSVKMLLEPNAIELENALTTDYNVLRSWMIPSLMKVLQDNKMNEYPQMIFEAGTVFKKNKETETGAEEACRLAICMCGPETDFTRIKQVMDCLFAGLDVKYEARETEHASFIPGRAARIAVKGKDVAYIGEIHPQVLDNWGIDMPIAALELNLTELYRQTRQ